MEALLCPSCQAELDTRSKEQTCGQCQAPVRVTAICPTCQQELERLKEEGLIRSIGLSNYAIEVGWSYSGAEKNIQNPKDV